VTDPQVVARAAQLGAAAMPGAHTPTEMLAAHRAGAPFVKLFPAPAGGPEWLRSVLAPLPFLRVVPTNGVDAGNAREWLAAGAWALGFARSLFVPADLEERRFERIEQRAGEILAAVRHARI
jgi:2-dehydro-3-deoxyphosphogluconate aldolase/(4S)-4-hydroxy-2-oxoglutarate aldolase